MKFSKLLKMMLGLAGLFRAGIVEDGGGGSEPLDVGGAADAFSSLGAAPSDGAPAAGESPEAAAERLASRELAGEAGDADDDGEGAAPAEPDDVTVEIDGKPVKLTKAQIAESHKRAQANAAGADEAAKARQAADAEVSAARQQRQEYAQKLGAYAIQLQGALQEQAQTNWQELLDSDPVEYLKQERIFNARQAALGQAQQEQARIAQQQHAEQAQSAAAHRSAQQQDLLAKLPEWKDADKARAESEQIKDYLTKQGFSPQKIDGISDAAEVLVHRKAMLYDALIERAGKAVKKVAALPAKAERPGGAETSKPDARTTAMQRLGKTGSIDAAAGAFMQFMK